MVLKNTLRSTNYTVNEIIEYKENIFPGTRDELISLVRSKLSIKRFEHVLRVEQTALDLSKQHQNVDLEKVSIAALVHDYAKERSNDDFINKIKEKHLDQDLLNWNNAIWHGVVGPEFIKDELRIYDEEVLDAVRYHTTGNAYMTTLAKLIYMADYLEPHRDFPGVEDARNLTYHDLNAGVIYQTWHTLKYLIEKKSLIYPATILTYNSWVAKH